MLKTQMMMSRHFYFTFFFIFITITTFGQNTKPLPQSQLDFPFLGETNISASAFNFDNWRLDKNLSNFKGWKWNARYMDEIAKRVSPNGKMPSGQVLFEAAEIKKQSVSQNPDKANSWSPIGPYIIPPAGDYPRQHGLGRVNCITFHPSIAGTFYVGVAQGGIWKTTDGGQNYTPLGDGLPIMRISDICIDPNNPNTIYASLGDFAYLGWDLYSADRKRASHYGLGVYKSTNGGNTWSPTGLSYQLTDFDGSLIRRVFVKPGNSNIVTAAGTSGIYHSTDGGNTWTTVMDSLIRDLEKSPSDPNVLYASGGFVNSENDGYTAFYKSTDFGANWNLIPYPFPAQGAVQRAEIAVSPSNPNYIYMVASGLDDGLYGVYRSTDAGQTWQARFTAADGNILGWDDLTGIGGQGSYSIALMVDPLNPDIIYCGGVNLWMSSDGGLSWNPCSYWTPQFGNSIHADQHFMAFNPLDSKYYICTDGGVYRTNQIIPGDFVNDFTTQWQYATDGINMSSFYRLGLCADVADVIIGGAQDNSTYYNNGVDWVNLIGGDGMEALVHPNDPGILFGSSQYGNICNSTDGGQNFNYNIVPFQGIENAEWTTPFVMNPQNPDELLAGIGNVWKSTDGGFNWNPISSFTNMSGQSYPNIITALAQSPINPQLIYVGKKAYPASGIPSELWVSPDGGNNWQSVGTSLPSQSYISYIDCSENDAQTAYITYCNFEAGKKIYKTIDGGNNWVNISYNLPNIPVNCVLHQKGDSNFVYVGTDLGVYYTKDGLNQWLPYMTNLPNVIVNELEIHEKSKKLYAATFGRGFWVNDIIEAEPSHVGTESNWIKNMELNIFPNPNQGNFVLQANLSSDVSLKTSIVDVMGKVVYSEQLKAEKGNFQKSYNLEKLASGTYFLKIEHLQKSKVIQFVKE